jgi:hypothetical protein
VTASVSAIIITFTFKNTFIFSSPKTFDLELVKNEARNKPKNIVIYGVLNLRRGFHLAFVISLPTSTACSGARFSSD